MKRLLTLLCLIGSVFVAGAQPLANGTQLWLQDAYGLPMIPGDFDYRNMRMFGALNSITGAANGAAGTTLIVGEGNYIVLDNVVGPLMLFGSGNIATGTHYCTLVGSSSTFANTFAGISLGYGNTSTGGQRQLLLGNGANSGSFTNVICLGDFATVTANNQCKIGDVSAPLNIVGTGNLSVTGTITANGVTVLTNSYVVKGTVQLASGTNYVATAYASSNTPPVLTYHSLNGSMSTLAISNVVEGVSFTICSGNPADTNRVYWYILR